MTNSDTFNTKENILLCIDQSIKKAREIEKKKYPYAILINNKNGQNINVDSFTCLSKDGFKTIPVIKYPKIDDKEIKLTFSEQELLDIISKIRT